MAKYTIGDIFKGDFPITQFFGNNPAYYKQFGFNGHEGVDFGTPVGTPLLAPFKRNIVLQDQDDPKSGAYGNYIVVFDPDQKCAVWYCHLSVNNVEFGKEYPKGTVLGKTGNTGNTSGPHLHANFVETDANGNRLNTNNGFKGMLNILDGNLVEWKLGNQEQPVPEQPAGTITIPTATFEELVGKSTKYDAFVNAGFQNVEKVKKEIRKRDETIGNLNTQVTKLTSEHSALATDVSSLNAQVTTLNGELESLREQAKAWVEKQKILDQTEKDFQSLKLSSLAERETANRTIAQLRKTSYKTAPTGELMNEVIRRIFHINN